MATEMYRTAVSLPEDVEQRLFDLRGRDEFKRCSMSEIMRTLIQRALDEYYPTDKLGVTDEMDN